MVINVKSFSWRNIISILPQCFMLGPLLFEIYINDIDIDLCSKLCKFADTKIDCAVVTEEKIEILTDDLKNLASWLLNGK